MLHTKMEEIPRKPLLTQDTSLDAIDEVIAVNNMYDNTHCVVSRHVYPQNMSIDHVPVISSKFLSELVERDCIGGERNVESIRIRRRSQCQYCRMKTPWFCTPYIPNHLDMKDLRCPLHHHWCCRSHSGRPECDTLHFQEIMQATASTNYHNHHTRWMTRILKSMGNKLPEE